MAKHTWAVTIKTDAGSGPADSIDLFGSVEQNIGGVALGQKGLQVGVQDVELVSMAVTVANIISFFIKSDTDVRIRINSEVTPAQEFNLTGGKALAWNNANIPQPGLANPLTTNITAIYIFNKGTVNGLVPAAGLKVATVIGGFLLQQETQTS